MEILNIGILAHVDAGKTSLTERILFETGVIPAVGSVDKGTTQTDTMDLERARGITIKSAVVSFQLNRRKVNLIDTPGHADFVAEVERSLGVLDGVVLVVSAVEGVQAQTRRLAQAIRAAGLPLLIFVNKIDRLGARDVALLDDIRRKLKLRLVPMNVPSGLGDRAAATSPCDRDDPAWRDALVDLLAELDERVIEEFDRTGGELSRAFIEGTLRAQVAAGAVAPVYFGSAIVGAGVHDLLAGIEEWLPAAFGARDAEVDATVFKIARRASGEKIVYARVFAGELAVRRWVTLGRRDPFGELEQIEERITGLDRFVDGATVQSDTAEAGEIVGLHGLRSARIGDRIGSGDAPRELARAFPRPAFESVVRPVDPSQITRLRAALEQLAEQDPLISLRQRNDGGEISVRLFGEVQKEVVTDTLARDYGLGVAFDPSQTICVERVSGTGKHVELIGTEGNPFYATIGFRIEPGEVGSGIRYERELGSLPLAFYRAIEETVHESLTQGIHGWEVVDCAITLTHAGFWAPLSTAADFRKLTPFVLMQALLQGGTAVCEPYDELALEIPEDTFGPVCGALLNARAVMRNAFREGASHRIVSEIPTVELRGVEQQIPGLTRGEGGWTSSFSGYVPVTGEPPVRQRIGPNPCSRAQYLAEVARG
jgi:ribosomal protection tetracycline resistance protein